MCLLVLVVFRNNTSLYCYSLMCPTPRSTGDQCVRSGGGTGSGGQTSIKED